MFLGTVQSTRILVPFFSSPAYLVTFILNLSMILPEIWYDVENASGKKYIDTHKHVILIFDEYLNYMTTGLAEVVN